MPLSLRRGTVTAIVERHDELVRLQVDGTACIAYPRVTGPVEVGDDVVVNVQARELALGSGGFDVLHANLTRGLGLEPEPLAIDSVILRLTEALLGADPSSAGDARSIRLDVSTLARARQFLDAETTRVIRSSELEKVTGLTRYDLARQFRSAFGTSPYRYSLMRRLDRARAHLRRNRSLADVALAAGFADQAHLTRMFKAAFGVSPARYRMLAASRTP